MKPIAFAVALLFAATTAMAELHGAWTATTDDGKPNGVHMNLTRGPNHNMGQWLKTSEFAGLSGAAINSGISTPVQFQLVREAGTTSLEGSFKNGDGAGQWTFRGNPAYVKSVRALGVEFEIDRHGRERSEEEELFTLALLDVSTDYIKSMIAAGYKVSLNKYLEMRIFRVTPELVREFASLGFRDLSAQDLITSRIHKVTPDYVREMRAAGWTLSMDELVSSRIHGATPEFAAEMKKLGYGNLDHDDLVSFRIHRVTPEFIRELHELGYDNVRADDLVSMRIHRVTPEFIRELAAAGYRNVPVKKLVDMRIHNIDVKFIEKMNKSD